MSSSRPTSILVLSRAEVLALLSLRECIDAVERAFRLHQVWVVDLEHARAESMVARPRTSLGLEVRAAKDLREALTQSDVCVTCTLARRAFVAVSDVAPGTFIAAVGADAHGKQELEPALVARSIVVVDVLAQCAEIGELQHVLAAGVMAREQVHAELGEVVAGRRPGSDPTGRDHDFRQLRHGARGRRCRHRGVREGACNRPQYGGDPQ